jgi:tRNA threonylcarbamoyladenosine biosynthesis protein TsaB
MTNDESLLAIDTSGQAGSIALLRDGVLLAEKQLAQSGRRHARTLVAEMAAIFSESDMAPAECSAVAVSVGPGSFTGLRVGVVCAKTFAYATGCQLTAVDTFEAIAQGLPDEATEAAVIDLAQRGELFVGHYRREGVAWQLQGSITIEPAEAWAANRPGDLRVVGPGLARLRGSQFAEEACFPSEFDIPQARQIATIGARQIAAGQTVDYWSLEPFYLRRSAAEEKAGVKVV